MKEDLSEAEKMSLAKKKYEIARKKYEQYNHNRDQPLKEPVYFPHFLNQRTYFYKAKKEYNQAEAEYRRALEKYEKACVKKKFKSVLARLWYKLWRK